MTIISSFISVSALVLLHLSGIIDSLIIRRHFHDGILYEDYAADSDSVRYTITSGQGWDDLDSLVETYNLRGKSMFCTKGPGAWLLYQDANYQYGTMRQLKLVYGEHCVPADNVNSLQPLGAVYVNIEDISAVVAFTEKYFASKGETTRLSISNNIKSAIFIGTGNWTVEIEGKKTCVVIHKMGDVCMLEDLQNSFSGTSDDVKIEKGCGKGTDSGGGGNGTEGGEGGDDAMEQYDLQTCYSTGFHELTYDFDFTLPSMKEICSGSYDESDQAKDKFVNVVKIWKKRMTPPTSNDFPTTIPNAPQRLNTLFQMVDLMGKTCGAISTEFLDIIKYIYLLHIKNGEIWNVTNTPNGTKIEQSHAKWQRAQAFVMECANTSYAIMKFRVDSCFWGNLRQCQNSMEQLEKILNNHLTNSEVATGCQPDDISEMKSEKEIATIEDFLNGESYDYVIEHIWLLLNYVSTYCNHHMGFKNNDWSIFPLLFKRDFLYPLQEQWKNPGKWATFYPAMFNGYDMEKERKAMITCVQAIIKLTPFYDPLARPPGFYTGNSTVDRDIVGGVTRPTITTSTAPGLTPAPTPTPPKLNVTKPGTLPTKKTARRRRQPDKEGTESERQTTSSTTPPPTTLTTTITTTTPPADVKSTTTHVPKTSALEAETTTVTSRHRGPKKSKKKKNKKTTPPTPTIITIGTTAQPETRGTSKSVTEDAEELAPIDAMTLKSLALDIPSDVTEIVIGSPTEDSTVPATAADNPSDATEKTKGKVKRGKGKRHSGNHHKKEKKPKKERKNLLENVVKLSDMPPPTNTENEVTGGA